MAPPSLGGIRASIVLSIALAVAAMIVGFLYIPPPTLTVQGNGTILGSHVTALNFIGTGVVTSGDNVLVTVNISAGTSEGSGGNASAVVMDEMATPEYPTNPVVEGVWYGSGTKGTLIDDGDTAIGNYAQAAGGYSTSIGPGSIASGSISAAFSAYSTASGESSIAAGFSSVASGIDTIAIGSSSSAVDDQSIAIGHQPTANGVDSVSIGTLATTSTTLSIAIGREAAANGNSAISIGYQASATGLNAIAIGGAFPHSNGNGSIAIGADASTNSAGSLAIGYHASNAGQYQTCIGFNAVASTTATSFGIGINSQSITPATLGVTLNSELNVPSTRQIELYGSLFRLVAIAGPGLTTTLVVSSAHEQFFTGTNSHTVVLPVVTTLVNGFRFLIVSNIATVSATITVQSSGGGTVAVLQPGNGSTVRGGWGYMVCIDIGGGTSPTSWSYLPGQTTV